jgi:hypothetical protein
MRHFAVLSFEWFVQPLPIWDYWLVLLLPLSIAVAIVYKSIKCKSMKQVPREATVITFWILLSFAAAAFLLNELVRVLER